MTAQLDIYKMALEEVGSRATLASTSVASREGNICNLYYPNVRDQALRAARWNFAKRTDTLALWKALPGTPENQTIPTIPGWLHTYPAPPWLYSYNVPSDFLYARSIIMQADLSTITPPIFSVGGTVLSGVGAIRTPFEVAIDPWSLDGTTPADPFRKVILTNTQSPLLEYTFQVTNTLLYDPEFIMVIVLALAARIAVGITQDKQLANMKVTEANNLIVQARVADGNEGPTILDSMPDWLTVRGVGNASTPYNFYYPYGPLFSVL